ncbi:MAG: DEAD/DEAH box helicase, partial [Candidatus Aenigmatarchaeota archaeon]
MIEIIKAKDIKNDKKVLELLTPYFRRWFEKRFNGKLTLPQKYSIPLIKEGENVLITSPTGSGKTLACFAAILDYLFRLAEKNELEDKVYCIYISPLRALDNDIKRNLEVPLKEVREIAEKEFGIKLQEIRIAIRTGDTKASEKQKQLKYPPHILITTPETLAIILNSIKFKEKLKDVKFVIVDEVHELANSKRGVHLTLSLERLENFVGKPIQRIGAGATLHPIEEAAKFLVGVNRSCKIIDARFVKQTDLKVLIPAKNLILEKAEEINKKMYKLIDKLVDQHRTTLIFTNTRSGAERVHWHLKQLFPSKYLDEITGVHHSSVSRDIRFEIEEKLKRGEIKVVVCVSGDSIVWTENGPKKIRDIKNSEKVLSIDKNLKVSFSRFEKLFSSDYSDLAFEIETENGMKIKCTSFHKFLSIENSRLVWKTAEELKVGDYVGVVRKLETKEEKINILEVLPDGYYIEIEPEFLQHLKKVIKEKFGTLKNFSKNLNIKYETLKNCLSGNNAMNIRIFKEIVK